MESKIILEEKDIKRAIEEYLLNSKQGRAKAIRLEQGNSSISADPREYSSFYAEVELEVETEPME